MFFSEIQTIKPSLIVQTEDNLTPFRLRGVYLIIISMEDLELEMKTCFLEEAVQLLEDAEQNFLSLEEAKDHQETIESLFRLAHNLKGSARAVGFSQIAEFTHSLESLLLKLKNKELTIKESTVTLLLECKDHLSQWVDLLKRDMNASFESSELLQKIHDQIDGKDSNPAATDAAAAEAVEAPSEEESFAPSEVASFVAEEAMIPEPEIPAQILVADPEIAAPAHPPHVHSAPVHAAPAPAPTPIASAAAPKPAAPAAPAKAEDESVRVSLSRLEQLINNVGELVILQTVLNQHKNQIESPLLQRTVTQLSKITKDLQDISLSLRMVPLKSTFQKMQRIVRDTSKALGKDIVLHIAGEQTEVDKTVVELLGDPLVHLIRNAVDHGVESGEDRVAAGKKAQGNIYLNAYHRGGQIYIEVRDDGKGLHAEKLRQKAIEKGIISPTQNLTPQQCHQLIFAAGFSTKSEVSEISGRGVGMDVVKTNIEKKLQGEIELETEVNKGTCCRIKLPLTLAIIDGMVLKVGDDRYVVPLNQVHETLQPADRDIHKVTGLGEVLNVRGESIPLLKLGGLLARKAAQRPISQSIAIVVRSGGEPFAILVDDILGQQQIVIKQLGLEVRNLVGITGGAILGDGHAALILDLQELVTRLKPSSMRGAA